MLEKNMKSNNRAKERNKIWAAPPAYPFVFDLFVTPTTAAEFIKSCIRCIEKYKC